MTRPDWLSERMVFGLLIMAGYVGLQVALTFVTVPPENMNLLSQGNGALGTAVGVIVAAIWKTDRVERQNSESINELAKTVASQATTAGTVADEVTAQAIRDDKA